MISTKSRVLTIGTKKSRMLTVVVVTIVANVIESELTTMSLKRLASLGGSEAPIAALRDDVLRKST